MNERGDIEVMAQLSDSPMASKFPVGVVLELRKGGSFT